MSILNFYQLALVSTIVATIVAANWVRKQMVTSVVQSSIPTPPSVQVEQVMKAVPNRIGPEIRKLTTPITDSVKERIQALDKLFDENVISVDEYVELRKRALG